MEEDVIEKLVEASRNTLSSQTCKDKVHAAMPKDIASGSDKEQYQWMVNSQSVIDALVHSVSYFYYIFLLFISVLFEI